MYSERSKTMTIKFALIAFIKRIILVFTWYIVYIHRGSILKKKINFEITTLFKIMNEELQEQEIQNWIKTVTKTFSVFFSFHENDIVSSSSSYVSSFFKILSVLFANPSNMLTLMKTYQIKISYDWKWQFKYSSNLLLQKASKFTMFLNLVFVYFSINVTYFFPIMTLIYINLNQGIH